MAAHPIPIAEPFFVLRSPSLPFEFLEAWSRASSVLGAEDPAFVLRLLGDRNAMMNDLRQRVNSESDSGSTAQDALFRMTILFERAIWLARRLVTDMSQAQKVLST